MIKIREQKGSELVIHRITRINFKYMMLSDRNQTKKRLLLLDSIYVAFWKRQKSQGQRMGWWLLVAGQGRKD